MNDKKPFGIGFIGCGSYNSSLAGAAALSPKLKAIACYDIDHEKASEFALNHVMDIHDDLDDLLRRDDIDGVVIATPNNAHRQNVEAAAKAGKHIYVDKPIANTVEDAYAIVRAADRAGVVLAVGHNGRRHGGHRKMKQMIDQGMIGTPLTVEANFSHAGGLNLKPDEWRFNPNECPALPMMQLGVHFADTVQYLVGDVTEVSSFMTHVATPADNYDVTVSLLKFSDGLLGYLGSNYASPPVYYVNVYGTGGNLYCEGGVNLRYRKPGSDVFQKIRISQVNTQQEELEEFARCAVTGERFEVDGEAALKALAVVRAALDSHEQGRAVTIAETLFLLDSGNVSTVIARKE